MVIRETGNISHVDVLWSEETSNTSSRLQAHLLTPRQRAAAYRKRRWEPGGKNLKDQRWYESGAASVKVCQLSVTRVYTGIIVWVIRTSKNSIVRVNIKTVHVNNFFVRWSVWPLLSGLCFVSSLDFDDFWKLLAKMKKKRTFCLCKNALFSQPKRLKFPCNIWKHM